MRLGVLPADQWTAFCGLCKQTVAEGTEVEVKQAWADHRVVHHGEMDR